jgi:enoyl-[acyl-carrier protein] reductase II
VKTAITELFGVDYPILNAGMGRVALPAMVAAVSNSGGLGVLGAGSSPPEVTRQWIREVRALTQKPFAVNCPLGIPNGIDNAKICLEEQVPVINYSMGKGDWICKAAHAYGGKVMASVTDQKVALRAQDQGCDAVIAAGFEAAGHSGSVTTFTLIPRLVEVLDIPVIAAGGVANGAQLIAALALGASGVSMGTRFWVTKGSSDASGVEGKGGRSGRYRHDLFRQVRWHSLPPDGCSGGAARGQCQDVQHLRRVPAFVRNRKGA